MIGISTRRLADSTVPASSTQRGGGRGQQPVEPAQLDVAREVHPGRGAGEPGALQEPDRQDEGHVLVGA